MNKDPISAGRVGEDPAGAAPRAGRRAQRPAAVGDAGVERAVRAARLEGELRERYVIRPALLTLAGKSVGCTEYRFRDDTSLVAFAASPRRLATDSNSPTIARSMVDLAQARNWQALRVSGHDEFRRTVWLEASARGLKTLGYSPSPLDLEQLARARGARLGNRIEPARAPAKEAPTRAAATGHAGQRRDSVLAAIDAVLVARKVPKSQRAAVMAVATRLLQQRSRQASAPHPGTGGRVAAPTATVQRTRGPAGPAASR